MATITITRGLDPLISAFNQQSIEFTINTGVIPTVTIDSVGFLPVKTVTNVGGLDTYVMDLTDILPYYMGFPPKSFDVLTGLTKSLSVAVSGAGAATQTITTVMCFGINSIGEKRLYNATPNTLCVYSKGRYNVAYTNNGLVSFYFTGANGTYKITKNSSVSTVALVNGYNEISGFPEGTTTVAIEGLEPPFATYAIFTVIASVPVSKNKLQWIDQDGCLSSWEFDLMSTKESVKDSNEIPLYNQTHSTIVAKDMMITKDLSLSYNLYTIAKDTTHFAQLMKISRSHTILGFGKLLRVTSIPDTFAECRQNLRFNITLEVADYVATY